MAISPESYGRGRTVYGNGSYAPTSGTVDPQGYIDRSLNNPSSSRSGLAAAALARLKGGESIEHSSVGVLPLGDVKTLTLTPTGQLIPNSTEPELDSMQPALSGNGGPSLPPIGGSVMSPLAQAALSRILASGGSIPSE